MGTAGIGLTPAARGRGCVPQGTDEMAVRSTCTSGHGLPRWLRRWRLHLQSRRPGFHPWVGKTPWRRKWQPTPVLLLGESHGQRSLEGYSPWSCQESDGTEHTCLSGHRGEALRRARRLQRICCCFSSSSFLLSLSSESSSRKARCYFLPVHPRLL